MLSRVADSIFWMSRYIERAENVARFIDVNLNLTLDLGSGLEGQWSPMIYTTGDQEKFLEIYGDFGREKVIEFLTSDRKNPNSILSCLMVARENARAVRDMISSAMWEEINKFFLMVRRAADDKSFLQTGGVRILPSSETVESPHPGDHRLDDEPQRVLALCAHGPAGGTGG